MMMDCCDVSCSWKILDNKKIKDAITYVEANSIDLLSESADEFVSVDTCLQFFTTQSEYNDCTIKISCKQSNFAVNSLIVLSEARNIEVYGHQNEYLHTFKGDLEEKVDDMAVYCKKIQFDKPANTFTLKFVSINDKYFMWLYGIKICLSRQTTKCELPQSSVDLNKVKEMLLDTHRPLSESAEKFLNLVEEQQKQQATLNLVKLFQQLPCNEKSPAKILNGSNNMPTITDFCNIQNEMDISDFSSLMQTILSHHSTKLKEIPMHNKAPDFFNLMSSLTSSKPYTIPNKTNSMEDDKQRIISETITQKLQEMEERILNHVAGVEERLQAKLDRLIALLDNNQRDINS